MSQGMVIKGKTNDGQTVAFRVDDDGQLLVAYQGLTLPSYDAIVVGYPTATSETYTYKTGGTSGVTTGVLTVTYLDNTKEQLSTASLEIV